MTSIYRRKGRKGWTVAWLEPDGRKRQVSKRTRELAEQEAAKINLADTDALAPNVLFADYARAWLDLRRPHVSYGTGRTYGIALNRHILPALGSLTLRAVTRRHVLELVNALQARGLRKLSVCAIHAVLRQVLQDGIRDQILRTNVAANLGLRGMRPTRGERRAQVRAMTVEQLQAFLAASEREPRAWGLAFRLAVSTGVRGGELLALRWTDFDFVTGTVHVRRGRVQSAAGWEEGPTKTRAERDVDIPPDLLSRLKSAHAAAQADVLASGRQRLAYVFPTVGGRMRQHLDLARAMARVLSRAKLPDTFTPHCLRHTYATQQLLAGSPIQYVREQLGHSSITITVDLYGSWLPASNARTAAAFERRLQGLGE